MELAPYGPIYSVTPHTQKSPLGGALPILQSPLPSNYSIARSLHHGNRVLNTASPDLTEDLSNRAAAIKVKTKLYLHEEDNCDLERLSVSGVKLEPLYKSDITRYQVRAPSQVTQLSVDTWTRDSGATCTLLGGGGSRTVTLRDGLNPVVVEVTAEDGTAKKYPLEITEFCASLEGIALSEELNVAPPFAPDVLEYSCTSVLCHISITVLPLISDSQMKVTVNGRHDTKLVPIAVGDTVIEVLVFSADSSNSQLYRIIVTRAQLPFWVQFADAQEQIEYECPISLAALYRPVSIKGSMSPNAGDVSGSQKGLRLSIIAAGVSSSGAESPVTRAFLKYKDALSLDPNNWQYNFHVGRHLLLQKQNTEALKFLQNSLALRPASPIARCYVGLALLEQENGPRARGQEAMADLRRGLEDSMDKPAAQERRDYEGNTNPLSPPGQ
ncbi:LOW QUALITY PROTEIN: uncharacterized protein RB166_021483 [Leptodactylus fuscus]